MDSDQQEMCAVASRNARALEEILLTYDDVINLSADGAEDVVDRCEQIIHCMRECLIREHWVEVKLGEYAEAGDKVITEDDELILNEEQAEVHNEFEPDGYSSDSYKRFRLEGVEK